MTFSRSLTERTRGLAEQFRSSLADLVGAIPLTAASVSIRPREDGPLEVLYTCGFEGAVTDPKRALSIPDAALRWLENHGRELVLAVGPEHRQSVFHRSFVEHGLRSVIIAPVFRSGRLAGTVTVGSSHPDAYTHRHLTLLRMMTAELTPFFARPTPPHHELTEPVHPARAHRVPSRHVVAEVKKPEPAKPVEQEPPHADEARIEADALGRVASWNDAAEAIFGWSKDEVIGNFLTLFYRQKSRHLIDPRVVKGLLRTGSFRGRALCYDSRGLAVTCEVEISELAAGGQVRGFRGRFRPVRPETLLPREEIEFGFARLYAFTNPVK